MDPSSISAAYGAIKAVKDIGKGLLDAKIDIEAEAQVNEVLEKLGSIQDTLFYVREELQNKQNEAHALAEKVRELESRLEQQGKIFFRRPSYWVRSGEGEDEYEDGPFCQRCYDVENNLVRLQGGNNDRWHCQACKAVVFGNAYRKPRVTRSHSGFQI